MEKVIPKEIQEYQKKIRCPYHNCVIGYYDARHGLVNTAFHCPKCKAEYVFTIRINKNNIKNVD